MKLIRSSSISYRSFCSFCASLSSPIFSICKNTPRMDGGLQWRAGTAGHGDGDAWQELGWSRLLVDQLLDLVDQLILVRQQAGRAALVHVGGA